MLVYFIILALLVISFVILDGEKTEKDVKLLVVALLTVVLTAVAGLRYYVGTDYANYAINYPAYRRMALTFTGHPALGVVARLSALIYNDYATWFFLMALITVIPFMIGIYRKGKDIPFSVAMLLFLGVWHGSFNTVKQYAAAAILFLGYDFIVNRKFLGWFCICLLASTFHITALIMIPVYFLISSHASLLRCAAIVAFGVILVFSYDYLFDMISFLKNTEVSSTSEVATRSVNIMRILVACAPVALWFILRRRFDYADKDFSFLLNMSIFNAVLSISVMSSVYLTRFTEYTNVYNILFIPRLVEPFEKDSRKIVRIIILVMYCAFWLYDISKGSTTSNFHWIFER